MSYYRDIVTHKGFFILKELSHSELKLMLSYLYKAKQSPMIWGTFGIGKSMVVREFAQQMGLEFIDLRMATIMGEDLRGIPQIQDRVVDWCIPSMFAKRKVKPDGSPMGKVIFLDELNLTPPSTTSAAYQLILDRKIGDDFVLIDEDFVVGAGNVESDGAATYDMPPPLSNRFFNIILRNNSDEFLAKADEMGAHASIIGYITANPQDLHTYNSQARELVNGTNRSWIALSNLLKVVGNDINKGLLSMLTSGLIPESTGTKFTKFFMDGQMFPSYDSVVAGRPDRELKPEYADSAISFIIGGAQFIKSLDRASKPEKAEKLTKFILDAPKDCIYPDSKVSFCRSLLRDNPELADIILGDGGSKAHTVPSITKIYREYQSISKV